MKEDTGGPLLHRTGSLIALFSAVLLLSGFIHLSILYSSFGISVGQYFLLGDYVACSIEQIYHAVWGAIGVGIGYLLLGDLRTESALPNKFPRLFLYIIWFGIGLSILSVGYLVICLQNYFFEIGLLTYPTPTKLAVVMTGTTVFTILSGKFQLWTLPVNNLILALLFFFTSLILNTFESIEEIKEGTRTDRFTVKVGNRTFTEQQSQIIGSNSRYMFLYLGDETTRIIPLNQISSVSIAAT